MQRDAVITRVRQAALGEAEAAVLDTIEPAIRLETRPVAEDEIAVGATKFGGSPDLPPDFAWPHADGNPHTFIAQISLADVHAHDEEGVVPASGLLTFFYDCVAYKWGFDPADRGYWHVALFDGDPSTLVRTPMPSGPPPQPKPAQKKGLLARLFGSVEPEFSEEPPVLTPCAVTCRAAASLPGPNSPEIERLVLTRPQRERLLEMHDALFAQEQKRGAVHQLLGHAIPIQGDVVTEAAVVTQGVYMGESSAEAEAAWDRAFREPTGWRLLLQVDSDDEMGMMWGDCGMLYYCIRDDDLRARRFDGVWLISQCY
jgi:uncharacterized protein YwqG